MAEQKADTQNEKAVVVKGRKNWQDRGKCTYSFTCEDLVKVLLLQFIVTKAAVSNPNFHLGVRFSSGPQRVRDGWPRLFRPNEERDITAVGFSAVSSVVMSPGCNRPNCCPLTCKEKRRTSLNWTLAHGGNTASVAEEDTPAGRSEFSMMECDPVGEHHTVWPIPPLRKWTD